MGIFVPFSSKLINKEKHNTAGDLTLPELHRGVLSKPERLRMFVYSVRRKKKVVIGERKHKKLLYSSCSG